MFTIIWRKKIIFLCLFLSVAAFLAGVFVAKTLYMVEPSVDNKEDLLENSLRGRDSAKWGFINPLLDCTEIKNISNKEVVDLKEEIFNFIEKQKKIGNVDSMAVYFRDLNNGPWFGISEKENFYPASLLKVPLMLSVLRQSMDDPSFLVKQFVWQGPSKNNEYFKAAEELQEGVTYSVGEALSYMIRYSDNNAAEALVHIVDKSVLLESYNYLGIKPPEDSGYEISVRTYASFFRILYNSTFLNKEYSEDALHLLSNTEFSKGIVAGVPASIKVAHKFGEREASSDVKQLHDCGIIYLSNRPYLLCVMTRGKSFDKMALAIQEVSKIVYDSVSAIK